MRKIKQGQIVGQVFIYMMAVIVIGGIAIIGYNAINKLSEKSCNAEKATFKTDMESLIEKRTSYGSVWPEVIKAPCQYDTICFVDASRISKGCNIDLGAPQFLCDTNKIIVNSVCSNVQTNMFVISGDRTIPLGYSELISLNETYTNKCMCIKQRNKNFYMTFNGKGASTEITQG